MKKNKSGFTLVEVLVALLILGMLIVPVGSAFLHSTWLNHHLQQRMAAIRKAQGVMEAASVVVTVSQSSFKQIDPVSDDGPVDVTEHEQMVSQLISHENIKIDFLETTEEVPFLQITATAMPAEITDKEQTSEDSRLTVTFLSYRYEGIPPWAETVTRSVWIP